MRNIGVTYKLLRRLAMSPDKVVTHEALALAAYGDNRPKDVGNNIAVLLCRYKCSGDTNCKDIVPVRGVGYMMTKKLAKEILKTDNRKIVISEIHDTR